jgi:adenosylmethionine-8-amino-7-oxononanoate aminotransferase
VGAALGAVPAVPEYFPLVRQICDEQDVLFIADEVMTGCGRTGAKFGVDHWKVIPDIIATAKGISGGYTPLAAVILRDRIMDLLREKHASFRGGHTYCANPLSARVGMEVLDIIKEQDLSRMFADGLRPSRITALWSSDGWRRGAGADGGSPSEQADEGAFRRSTCSGSAFEEAFARGLRCFRQRTVWRGQNHIPLAPPFIITGKPGGRPDGAVEIAARRVAG